ncbi:MAG: TlpA disulfide reductase family protein [Candidatus Thermoplasmatota archaeon]
MTKKILIPLIIGVLFILVLLVGVFTFNPNQNNSEKNTGHDFTFIDCNGNRGHLKDYRGKVVILDMWATWCTPCQYQMLELRKIYENYSREDLEILSIDIDPNEDLDTIKKFIELYNSYGYDLPWVFGKDDTGDIWRKYKVGTGGIPALCIFDRNGEMVFTNEGLSVYSDTPQGFPSNIKKLAPILDKLI